MNKSQVPALSSTLLLSSFLLFFGAFSVCSQSQGVTREVWLDIPGSAVADLTNHVKFPSQPDSEEILSMFEAPAEYAESYGQRLRAYVTAPVTGVYRFWISSDDASQLFFSYSTNPASKQVIASVPGFTGFREWSRYTQQQSGDISLVAGQKYYLEALMKEGGGGDNLSVRWRFPNYTFEEPIPGSRLSPYGLDGPIITRQPTNTTILEKEPAAFSLDLARYFSAGFQWFRDSNPIPGATNSTFRVEETPLLWNGSVFRCIVTNCCGSVTSAPALLTVSGDITPPVLRSVAYLGDSTRVTVTFSEPVESVSALNSLNYTLSPAAAVQSVSFAGDSQTVILRTSALQPGLTYTLVVNGVRDLATSPNTILANTQRSFSLDYSPLDMDFIKGNVEPLGPSTRATGLIISEIMYHPADRPDTRNLEFVEIYNSDPVPVNVSGYRLDGDIQFTFPAGLQIPARSFLLVGASPTDLQAVYSLSSVHGPWSGSLPNNSGRLRLWNAANALLLNVSYEDSHPWPVAADGSGHSLVLARPSFGEGDFRAWRASDVIGGSPARPESVGINPYRTVQINEFLAHTDPPDVDFIELHNYGTAQIDLSGCFLSDNPNTNKFQIPQGTTIAANGFLAFTESQLGFSLSSSGETLFLRNPDNTRVIDVLRFAGQENGVSSGRYPDGSSGVVRLALSTPGSPNAVSIPHALRINEIMYNPISGDELEEYIEIYNRSASSVAVGDWRLGGGIDFTIPSGVTIPANGYLVVAKNRDRLLSRYPGIGASTVIGNFGGTLNNNGERLALLSPDTVLSTNNGVVVTNTIWILADEVEYRDGGRWSHWADGRGSSLELTDVRANSRAAPNWSASDDSADAPWVTIEHTGTLDHGWGACDELQVMLLGAGECLVDNLEVIPAGSQNRVSNGLFDNGLGGWTVQGNHVRSGLASEGFQSTQSFHLRASGGGDNGANLVKTKLTSGLAAGQVVTIRGKARWLRGHPTLLLRLRGNYLEAVGNLMPTPTPGTPGSVNSRRIANHGPSITEVTHFPVTPAAFQSVRVIARIEDPDSIGSAVVRYRVDPSQTYSTVQLAYNGAGLFSAFIPGQGAGAAISFYITASDAHQSPASSAFPDDAPTREAVIRFGEVTPSGNLGVFRLWMSQTNLSRWSKREKLSNEAVDGTFVYGNSRVVYNAGAHYRGSPFIRPSYSTPVGNPCSYKWIFPEDDRVFGADEFNLDSLEPGRDDTRQRERTCFWLAGELGLPYSHQRYIILYVNGYRRGDVYTDSYQPGSDYVQTWYPGDDRGEIYKIDDWFEFDDTVNMNFNRDATLEDFLTGGGVKKQARYRWSWERKSNRGLDDNYHTLFDLVDALNTTDPNLYTVAVESLVDVEQWARVFAARRIAGDWDGYSYARGKNMFAYKPADHGWQMLLWDLDFSLGAGSREYNQGLFDEINDPVMRQFLGHAPFRRAYLRAMHDAAYGPLVSTSCGPVIDAMYSALQGNGISAASPADLKLWLNNRRTFLVQTLNSNYSPLEFTINNGNGFSVSNNFLTLSGKAHLQIKTIRINGIAYPATWSSITNWTLEYALRPGVNALQVDGLNSRGNVVAGFSDTIQITNLAPLDLPQQSLVINEIMYNPAVPGAEYVELFNRSKTTAFDLTGYRIDGIDFDIPAGTVIRPGAYLLAVENLAGYATTYGPDRAILGQYSGQLDNGGETLRLLAPTTNNSGYVVIDEVTFEDDPPWPGIADGFGPSLQLKDSGQDNNRVANWCSIPGGPSQNTTVVPIGAAWKYSQAGFPEVGWEQPGFPDAAWLSGPALLYVETAALPELKRTSLTLGSTTYYFRHHFTYNGDADLASITANLILDDGAIIYLNGTEVLRIGMAAGVVSSTTLANRVVGDASYEGPFTIPNSALVQGNNVLAVEVHQVSTGSSDIVWGMSLDVSSRAAQPYTPGSENSVGVPISALPSVWLNEVQVLRSSGPKDNFGELEPWVELHNSGSNRIDLATYYLTDTYTNLTKWSFPAGAALAPGEFKLIWLDGQSHQTTGSDWHANFRPAAAIGNLALIRGNGGGNSIVDYLNFNAPQNYSYGAFPDGTPARRTTFYIPTPGAPNTNGFPAIGVFINEWMADNERIPDPSDGDFDDWFELFNASDRPVDLSGFTLTDSLAAPTKWTIPAGTVIPAGGFLLVWADEELLQNKPGGDLHADFKLSLGGEALGLYAPNGIMIDGLSFGPQTSNVSEGRIPDGSAVRELMLSASPGQPNRSNASLNRAPALSFLPDLQVAEGSVISFTAAATDPDTGQRLTFALDAGAPAGASLNSETGLFSWRPTELQGPGTFFLTIQVSDNGFPVLSDSQTVKIVVIEVNSPPVLQPVANQNVFAGQTLILQCRATDPDLPSQPLLFLLDVAPAGAVINPATGVLSWRPTMAQAGVTHSFTVRVVDDPLGGGLSHVSSFSTMVSPPKAPVLSSPLLSQGLIGFYITGDIGPDYIIEKADGLSSPVVWRAIATNATPTLPILWFDPTEIHQTSDAAYRVKLGP